MKNTNNITTKKILLVDDHQIVIDGIRSLLEDHKNLEVIGTANNGKEALQQIELLQPDIVMMDIDMPIMNGILAAQKSKQDFPATKIIILSLHYESVIIRKMMESGVDGYLLKNADSSEMINAIQMVANGKKYFSAEVTMSLLSKKNEQSESNLPTNSSEKLALISEREIEVLKRIAEGYSSKEIAEELFISHRTVETHRTNIMKKLEIKKLAKLIKFALQAGLVN